MDPITGIILGVCVGGLTGYTITTCLFLAYRPDLVAAAWEDPGWYWHRGRR